MSQTLGSTGLCAHVKTTRDLWDTQELLQTPRFKDVDAGAQRADSVCRLATLLLRSQPRPHGAEGMKGNTPTRRFGEMPRT